MFISDIGRRKPFPASRTLVRPISTMAPGVTLHAVSVSMWAIGKRTDRTADPTTEDVTLSIVGLPQMIM